MAEPDELVPDEAWPHTYKIKEGDWKTLTEKAGVTKIGDEHRTAISEITAAYRYKSLAYPEGHDPRQLQRSLKSLQNHLAKAIEKLDDGDVRQALAGVERSYANLYSLPVGLHSKPGVELQLPDLTRAITILGQLTEHALRLRMFDKRRGFGSKTGLQEDVHIPSSYDPPLDELLRALVRYWDEEIAGPPGNSVDVTQEPPKGAPLTEFVHACLAIAKARDRNGKPFKLENVRQIISRARKA